jgi:hypothetical protein
VSFDDVTHTTFQLALVPAYRDGDVAVSLVKHNDVPFFDLLSGFETACFFE